MSFLADLPTITPKIARENTRVITEFFARNDHRFQLDLTLRDLALERVNLGKLMRGAIIVSLGSALGVKDESVLLTTASAIEIYGYGILVQDDVTDRALTRRGKPTIQQALSVSFGSETYSDPAFLAEQTAFYLGDVLYFIGSELLETLTNSTDQATRVRLITYRELQLLGLGQIEDGRLAALRTDVQSDDIRVTEDEILAMIAAKSGRYSVRWPMELAATLAGMSDSQVSQIGNIGEKIGVLFQLHDDELGLFGDEEVLGKSTSSDITEGKKTLFWSALQKALPANDPAWKTFGNRSASSKSIDQFKQILIDTGVAKKVRQRMEEMKATTDQEIASLSIPAQARELLQELTEFVLFRKK